MPVFLISNAIEGQLISTGAIEVVFNGKIIDIPRPQSPEDKSV